MKTNEHKEISNQIIGSNTGNIAEKAQNPKNKKNEMAKKGVLNVALEYGRPFDSAVLEEWRRKQILSYEAKYAAIAHSAGSEASQPFPALSEPSVFLDFP